VTLSDRTESDSIGQRGALQDREGLYRAKRDSIGQRGVLQDR